MHHMHPHSKLPSTSPDKVVCLETRAKRKKVNCSDFGYKAAGAQRQGATVDQEGREQLWIRKTFDNPPWLGTACTGKEKGAMREPKVIHARRGAARMHGST